MRFHFCWKSDLVFHSTLCLCSHQLTRNETQNGMDFILVILTKIQFQTGMRFSCEQNLLETKWISADSLDIVFNDHVVFETHWGYHCKNYRNFTWFPGVEFLQKGTVFGDLHETMRKLCLSAKFTHLEIRLWMVCKVFISVILAEIKFHFVG